LNYELDVKRLSPHGDCCGWPEFLQRGSGLKCPNFDADGLAFTFATLGEPAGEAFGKSVRRKPETGFEAAIGDRESVVEVGRVGEVAHAKLVEPFERAGFALASDQHIDAEFLGVHREMITLWPRSLDF
jgi:hypothetical protein